MAEALHPVQVVVAYDFSASAEEALARAMDVARRAPQHVLHVITAIDPRDGLPILPARDVDYAYAGRVHALVAERLAAAFAHRGVGGEIQAFVHARIGPAADEILWLAKEVGADLVFVGSQGKTGIDRFVLGSVSERVVREAQCPVMVARPKTYDPVELLRVHEFEHERHAYTPPHRYSYEDHRVLLRPNAWPIS